MTKNLILAILAVLVFNGCGSDSTHTLKEDSVVFCSYLFLENQSNFELTASITSVHYGGRNPVVIQAGETKEVTHGCDMGAAPELKVVAESMMITTLFNGAIKTVYSGIQAENWKKVATSEVKNDYTLTLTNSNLNFN